MTQRHGFDSNGAPATALGHASGSVRSICLFQKQALPLQKMVGSCLVLVALVHIAELAASFSAVHCYPATSACLPHRHKITAYPKLGHLDRQCVACSSFHNKGTGMTRLSYASASLRQDLSRQSIALRMVGCMCRVLIWQVLFACWVACAECALEAQVNCSSEYPLPAGKRVFHAVSYAPILDEVIACSSS